MAVALSTAACLPYHRATMGIHVVHAVSSLEPQAGSVAISLRDLFGRLQAADVKSTVVTLDAAAEQCGSAEVVCFDPGGAHSLIKKADVIHFHGLQRSLAKELAPLARRSGKPYVISPLGGLGPNPYDKVAWTERIGRWMHDGKFCHGAAAIAALNDTEADQLRDENLNRRVEVLPYGIDFGKHVADKGPGGGTSAPGDERHLLVLGPIHPVEGIVPLLRAVAELGHGFRGWHVVLAGPEREGWRTQLEAAIQRKGFSDRITLLPNPDLASQRTCLSQASILAAPCLCIRPPVSVQQAVAAGVPVLTSDNVLPPGIEGGVRVCSPNRDNLREALRSLINLSDQERAVIASKARDLGKAAFDWDVLAPKYVRLYSDLC